jgi:hypothetical protein
MSKRVYAVWFNGERISPIFLDRPEAEEQLVNADFILMQKDISEEEYAAIALKDKPTIRGPLFPLSPTAGCYEGWEPTP